jgi:ABC-type polysaccharide/polyol phosphate transport system ATPase subunit
VTTSRNDSPIGWNYILDTLLSVGRHFFAQSSVQLMSNVSLKRYTSPVVSSHHGPRFSSLLN